MADDNAPLSKDALLAMLSPEARAALGEHMTEKKAQNDAVSRGTVSEDFGLSQFWYDDDTAQALALDAVRAARKHALATQQPRTATNAPQQTTVKTQLGKDAQTAGEMLSRVANEKESNGDVDCEQPPPAASAASASPMGWTVKAVDAAATTGLATQQSNTSTSCVSEDADTVDRTVQQKPQFGSGTGKAARAKARRRRKKENKQKQNQIEQQQRAAALEALPECRIAVVSAPSIFKVLHALPRSQKVRAVLFEFDRRFGSAYPGQGDFVFYDFNHATRVPADLHHSFDFVVADPPYLNETCLSSTAQTMQLLARSADTPVLLNTGAVMEAVAKRFSLEPCAYRPKHARQLQNEFRSYANYQSPLLNGEN